MDKKWTLYVPLISLLAVWISRFKGYFFGANDVDLCVQLLLCVIFWVFAYIVVYRFANKKKFSVIAWAYFLISSAASVLYLVFSIKALPGILLMFVLCEFTFLCAPFTFLTKIGSGEFNAESVIGSKLAYLVTVIILFAIFAGVYYYSRSKKRHRRHHRK